MMIYLLSTTHKSMIGDMFYKHYFFNGDDKSFYLLSTPIDKHLKPNRTRYFKVITNGRDVFTVKNDIFECEITDIVIYEDVTYQILDAAVTIKIIEKL